MVGQRTLTPYAEVRILDPQPIAPSYADLLSVQNNSPASQRGDCFNSYPDLSDQYFQAGAADRYLRTKSIIGIANNLFAQSAAMGALPTLYAATNLSVLGVLAVKWNDPGRQRRGPKKGGVV